MWQKVPHIWHSLKAHQGTHPNGTLRCNPELNLGSSWICSRSMLHLCKNAEGGNPFGASYQVLLQLFNAKLWFELKAFIPCRYVHLQPNRFTCSEPGCDFSTRHKDTLLDHQVDDEPKSNSWRVDIFMLDPAHGEEALVLWHLWKGASLAQWTLPLWEDASGVNLWSCDGFHQHWLIFRKLRNYPFHSIHHIFKDFLSGKSLGCISVTNVARSSSRSRSWLCT